MTEHEQPRELKIVECIHGMVIVDAGSHIGSDGARLWVGGERTYECPKCKYPTANDKKRGVGLRLFRVLEAKPVEREREEMLDLLERMVRVMPPAFLNEPVALRRDGNDILRRHGRLKGVQA